MNSAPLARILIVDDEAAQMRALCDTLRDQGYETTGFTTGDDALRALQEKPFDLLLTDLMMPGMDGVALLAAALKIDPQLVGILMTGMGTIETAVQAMQAGALDYILKPFKVSAILPVVARAVSVRRLRLENLELRNTVAIHELNQAIAHTLDPNVLLDKIADAALGQFEADEASIMLLADDGRSLTIAAVRGEGRDALLGTRAPIGEGIAGWVAAHREPLVLEGEVKDRRLAPLHPRAEIQSALSMPMITRNKLIGVINVNCTRKRRAFTFGQIAVLSIFTNAAAAGLEAARLYDGQRKADARYREVLHMAADGIISTDDEQRILIFNAGAEEVFGYRPEEVLGKPLEMLLPAEAAEAHRRHVQSFGEGPDQSRAMGARDRRLFGRRKDGALVNVEVGISKRSENGKTLYTAVVRDITQRVQQEDKIARLTRIHRMLSGINSAIVRIRDRDELFREACSIAVEHGNFELAWIGVVDRKAAQVKPVAWYGAGQDYIQLMPLGLSEAVPEGRGLAGRAVRERKAMIADDIAQDPRVLLKNEALERGFRSLTVLPLLVSDEAVGVLALYVGEVGFFNEEEMRLLLELAGDISFALDHIQKEEKLKYLAHYDTLTGLPNRKLFYESLKRVLAQAEEHHWIVSVLFLDLDRFKNVNDTLGHAIGDALLQQVGNRLVTCLRIRDTVGRLGGDEFGLILLTSDGPRGAEAVAHKIREVLRLPFQLEGREVTVTASIGLTVYPTDSSDPDTLIKYADTAMYRAKEAGRDTYRFYTAEMNARALEKLELESAMRKALDNGEFVLHYQPKMEIKTGRWTGVEALIRWNRPGHGLVQPADFIPILEETGLIMSVGEWVVDTACRQIAEWERSGIGSICVAVNLSGKQFLSGFDAEIARAIRANRIDPKLLELELTETTLMTQAEGTTAVLQKLKALGIRISIDDFGTGYSSLAYLKRFPIDTLKIDIAFIRDVTTNVDDAAITVAIISMAHSLKLKVIAEGVETKEQLEFLRTHDCDEIQGYYLSRPVPAIELAKLYQETHAGSIGATDTTLR